MAILQPEREDRLRGAWNTDPDTATDAQSRAAARTLAREVLTAQTIAEMPEEQFKTEDERYGAAAKMVELMTGEKDYDGRLWNGGRGFKTGAEYLRSVKETLTRGMDAAADPELQAWLRMSDAEKDSLVESQRGILSHVGEGAGDVASAAGELVRGVPRLSKDEYSSAPEDVRRASDAMGSVMWDAIPENQRSEYEAKVRDWRGGEWQRLKRRGEYEAKLRRKNALLYLPDMIKSLKSDEAKALAGELAQNPSKMPTSWTARLEKLPTRDIETLAQIRGMTREHVEGNFLNWLGDMGISFYNGAHGILSGMGAQEAKYLAMAMGWDGEEVNEMINRKHALWSAYAGWSSPLAPLSEDHGALANFTIGLASAVPFIASMHLKGLGYIACASEMMSEADAQAAAAGIDITNPLYCARTALAGGLYAYMLKAVSPKFLGASANGAAEDIAMRTAFMKGVMSGVAKLDTLKVMSQRTASGALMMAMQQGIAAVNEDLNLGGDAWRDAAQRFTETFVSSIPDMLAFSAHGALEGHARASGGWRKMFTAEGRANRSQNLREAVENAFAVRTAVDGNARIDALRTNTALAQIAAMRRAWTEGGEKGLARLGFKPEEIAEAKDFFEAERKALGAAEKLDALERATDAESLEEIAEDAPLAERNDAARRFDEANGEYTRAVERLAETLRGKTADAPGVVRDLEAVRNVWAHGNAVGAGKVDGTDAGAAALVKAGFAPEDAAALSKAFGAERRGMYSPAATEALRDLYTRSTRGRVEATAALASAFGGRVRKAEGRTYIDLPMPDGGTGTLAVETVDLSQKFYGEAGSDPELARQVERATGGAVKADDWIRMDDAARRRAVKKHRLVDEGDFVVTDPADPSLHVSSGDAETVFGTIRIDPTADPGAAFHEAMHGFLRFCQETGFWDEADLKWLTDTYGKPQNAREQLNEEAAADGFRQYLAKRMAGAITDEPGPFRKLFGLIGRLRHLREARAATERLATNAEEALYDAFLAGRYQHIRDLAFAEPTAPKAEAGGETAAPQTGAKPKAEESPAENAEAQRVVSELPHVEVPRRAASYGEARQLLKAETGKPFTNAKSGIKASLSGNSINKILSGKAVAKSVGVKQHLAAAANIVSLFEGGELRATEEGNRKGVEAAKRIFARFDLDGESLVAKITVLEHGNGDNRIYSVEAMEVAKAGSILAPKDSTSQAENPALPSTPRIITQSGGENKGGNSPRVVRWEAQTPRGNKYVGGYYKVFKLSDLVHSNDPRYEAHAALQGRNRVDNKLEESDRVRIKAEFNGRRYLDNEVTSDGAPIIVMLPDAEGVTRPFVLSGNGRVLVLNDLAESHLYDRYRNPLKEWAAKNGVEMDVADADNPVLVRVLDDLKGSNLLEVSRLSNVRTSTPPTETELARTDAEYLRSLDLAWLYHANADGSPDMTPGVNDEFFRKFSQGPDAETTFDEKNNVGESAQRRIMRAFLHLAVGDSPRGLAAAEKLITMSGTYGIDRQKGALQMMAPGVARTEGNPDYAIGPDVARAIADFMDFTEMRRAGKIGKLDDYIAQGDMFDQPSEIAADILRTLAEGRGTARDMAERVNAYAEIAAHSDADGALGGAANARSRADVWREAKGLAEQRIAERTPKTRFSIRSEADGKKDEEKKENVVARVQPSEQGQNRPAHLRNDTTQHTLTLESAAPVREFGNSISQAGVKSPADFLTGLVHALGSEETNPDKTQYFDITHEDGKSLSLRVANHRATARQYTDHGNTADVKTSIVVKMSDKPFLASDGVELTEHVYFSDRLTAEREAGIARAVAGWIATGEWNGPAADQVNMSPRRRYSIAGVYTGTAADYANRSRQGGKDDGPSLKKIGTGEGSQVYGWGLYGSTVRGVAEVYANPSGKISEVLVNGERHKAVGVYEKVASMLKHGDAKQYIKDTLEAVEEMQRVLDESGKSSVMYGVRRIDQKYIDRIKAEIEEARRIIDSGATLAKPGNLYEQTFFTDRAPGDESHLLKWYDAISDANWDRVIAQAEKEGLREKLKGAWWLHFNGDLEHFITDNGNSGDAIYERLSKLLGGPQSASEFLARAGIDGVKYPVDSYGGKGVKDGDVAGWNYVSFRDDNIRVDHKWTDGQMRYSLKAGTVSDYSWATLTAKPDMQLAQIDPEKFKNYKTDSERVSDAHNSVIAAGGEKVGKNYYIRMDGERVLVRNAGITHRGGKPNLANDFVYPVLGEVLKNAVRVNELEPNKATRAKYVTDMFVYLGALSYGQEVLPVRIQVEHRGNYRRVDRIDVLYSLNTKIGTVATLGGLAPATPVPTISIANLVRIAQPLHPQIFSRDVAAALGATYRGGELDARYSVVARTPSDEIKADPESFARRSVVARATEGEADEKESALVAFVAERALRHGPKPNAIKTIGRLGLEMGLKMVDTKRIITKGEALAERVRGTVIEKAVRNGDVATATALLAREADIDNLVAGAAGEGGKLVRSGEGKIKSILDREIEKTVRSFNAASLADVERDTGIDVAGEILANSPEKFDPKGAGKREERKAEAEAGGDEGSVPGDTSPGEGNLTDYEIARRQRVRKEAEERVAKMIATAKERSEAAKKEREEWEAKRDERKRRAEEAAASGEDGGGESSEGGGEGAMPSDRLKLSTFADFKTPEEFAAFFRVWAEDRYKKEHGASTLGKHEEKRLFPEFYRKAVVRELQDLADKLLPPKGARATVNRWLGEIQPGVKPDTLERVSADVFAYINRNAIRESRTAQIQKFRNSLKPFVKGTEFDDLKLDADRRVTGWVEEAARYIRRVCNLSIRSINGEPSQLDQERERLQAILDRREKVYDEEGKNSADAPKFDMETRRALAKLQLLEKYGAMKRYMPGEIANLADEAMRWLQDEAGKLEAAWKDAREAEKSIRGALVGGIVGPNGQKYKAADGVAGWADRLFDSMNGMIRLRLQHLVRFADSAHQQKAKDAINRVVVMLGDGEVAFARHLQDDRMAFHNALNAIFTDRATGKFDRRACADWLNRMTEAIPTDLSRKLSTQGYADSMTYGQMLQLLVSLEQKSYAEAIRTNGRDGQADLIRTFETVGPDGRRERVLTDKDILFIDWLRSFYEAKRGMLSEVTKRMTGLPVDSPDPLYCPVKMYMGDQARGMHVDSSAAWDPIGAVFSRRMANVVRDFDESASILGQFFDRSAASANLVAWGERGSIIRGVFTDAGVQQSIRLAFGGGELTKILKQLEETFNGGENIRKAPGEIAAADKAMNWMTYLSLGYNPLSAMKQTTSFTVWANALPGGFRDLWRYMTDVDMATIKHIKESEAYKVRYGNEVGSGHDVASKGLFENPSENPVAAFFRKTSMGLLRKGDFLPGGWIAQGVFRDLYNRHLKEGMDADAADRLAMTETFNMLEETQQSGRTYNTAELAREHGRLGRLLVQFATSPLQQLQYETQAVREVRDLLRYKPSTPDADFEKRYSEAKGKLVRAAVINHVLLPAALHAVTNIYRLAMGYDPEWEKEGWHWSLLRDITLGQFSRVFFLGAISSVTTDVLITGKPVREIPALIPAEGVVKLFANMTVTARDIATLNYEQVQKDLDRLLKSTSITRTPYDVVRLLTGKAYAEREERREKRRQKDTKK